MCHHVWVFTFEFEGPNSAIPRFWRCFNMGSDVVELACLGDNWEFWHPSPSWKKLSAKISLELNSSGLLTFSTSLNLSLVHLWQGWDWGVAPLLHWILPSYQVALIMSLPKGCFQNRHAWLFSLGDNRISKALCQGWLSSDTKLSWTYCFEFSLPGNKGPLVSNHF